MLVNLDSSSLKGALRSFWPTGYDQLLRLSGSKTVRWISGAPTRAKIQSALSNSTPPHINIAGKMGFGGVLSNVVKIHLLCEGRDNLPFVTSNSSLYAEAGVDMIGVYFDRKLHNQKVSPQIDVSHVFDLPERSRFRDIAISDANRIFHTFYQVQPFYREAADNILDSFGKSIAVHYRGSDKRHEATAPSVSDIHAAIDHAFEVLRPDSLIIATDEPSFLAATKARYGVKAKDLGSKHLAQGATPAHFSSGDPREKGSEALITMLALSKAELCIRTPSLLSAWAKILNPELKTFTIGEIHRGGDPFPEREILRLNEMLNSSS